MSSFIQAYRVALKRGAAVEVSRQASHQHEFNGTQALKKLFGDERLESIPSRWFFLRDDAPVITQEHRLTWYDSRADHPSRTEWRLYYDGQPDLNEGDLIAIIRRQSDGDLVVLIAPAGSTWERQLIALFGKPETAGGRFVEGQLENIPAAYLPVAQELFEFIGWVEHTVEPAVSDLERLIQRFGGGFPSTSEFSAFAREREGAAIEDPDATLFGWWRREEALFEALEGRELSARLQQPRPFKDADDFLGFSLSIQNRRKSRAGHALENHVRALFELKGIRFVRGMRTEGQRRPDFILPGAIEYRDPSFSSDLLTMLAAKTTCRDRWRQVLSEASRIPKKHLLTLEAGISLDQLTEMHEEGIQLVVLKSLSSTYNPPPGMTLLSVAEFLAEAEKKQARLRN